MLSDTSSFLRARRIAGFDVICAGEVRWDLTAPPFPVAMAASFRFRPGGAAVSAALAIAAKGLRVGLAAALGDDSFGRELLARIRAAGIDVGGVSLSAARPGLVLVEGTGGAAQVVSCRQEEPPISIPEDWAARALLLTGLSPVVAQAAAFCKEARGARRAGTVVLVDINARRHLWMGQDPRAIRAVLGEADVVRLSAEDSAVLHVDAAAARAMMRPGSVLVATSPASVRVIGPFGEMSRSRRSIVAAGGTGAREPFMAAVAAELARPGAPGPDRVAVWERVLGCGPGAGVEASLQR